MLYFDTAYLVRCYVAETGFEAVRGLAAGEDGLVSCVVARVELASALQRKIREGWMDVRQVKIVSRQIELDVENGHLTWLPLSPAVLECAVSRIESTAGKTPLRALDAFHLACASENGFPSIYSNDRHMLAAAAIFGLAARNILLPV